MLTLCGLWKHTSKTGKKYMSGTLGGLNILLFKNEKKRTDKSPDYSICVAPKLAKQEHSVEDLATVGGFD